jgi:hypothetical protein
MSIAQMIGAIRARAAFGQQHSRANTRQELAELAQSLTELNHFADAEFLGLSRMLKALYGSASQLAEAIGERANSVRESLKQSRLDGQDGLASRTIAEIERDFSEVSDNLASLSETADALGRLVGHGQGLERLAMRLQVSGAGFAIESARTEECRASFGDFVVEMRALASRISTLGEAIGSQAHSARRELQALIPVISGQLSRLRQLTQQSDTAARQSADEVQRLLGGSREILEQAESQTRRIAEHAENAVYSLQSGDILRQKLEHVVAAIEDASRLFDQAAGGPGNARESGRLLAIQAAQLEAIRGEVESASRQLAAAFNGIAEDASNLGETLSRLERGGGGGPFDRLKSNLAQLRQLRTEGSGMLRQADESSCRAVEAASRLSEHLSQVEAINRQMQMQALNALVRTEQLGIQGQTLGVLSMHTHGIFQESCASVEQTVAVLEQVRENATRQKRLNSAASTGDQTMDQGLSFLDRANASLLEGAGTAAELIRRQGEELRQARCQIESLTALNQRMAAIIVRCAALRDQLGGHDDAGFGEVVAGHSDRYTMESERLVHEQLTAGPAAAETGVEVATASAPPDQDDNVEFF